MWDVTDGVVETVFGVMLIDGWYEAHPGEAEFAAGRLIRLRIGPGHDRRNDDGRPLTAGFTYFPGLAPGSVATAPAAGDRGYVRARGVTRVYAGGVLSEQVEVGVVRVAVDHLPG